MQGLYLLEAKCPTVLLVAVLVIIVALYMYQSNTEAVALYVLLTSVLILVPCVRGLYDRRHPLAGVQDCTGARNYRNLADCYLRTYPAAAGAWWAV